LTNLKIIPLIPFLLLGVACADDAGDPGEMLYAQPHDDGNTFACSTCHALEEPAADGFTRPGHPIGDAASRPNYKNGTVDTLLEAVNTCRTVWMGATAWPAGSEQWQALEGYLIEQAPLEAAPALAFDRIEPPADVSGGDMVKGQKRFNETCVVCHGEDAAGTQRAPSLAGRSLELDYIALRVRTSGSTNAPAYPGLTGGRMPFWSADRLSETELLDIAAYIETSMGNGDPGPGGDPGGEVRDCESTHAKIGSTATLVEQFHDVGGVATIVDDCTIRIDNFTFDGNGINVQVYGGLNEKYSAGFSMSGDIRRAEAYAGETITVQLPEGMTLDDMDGLSVWCVPAGQSFGAGKFSQ
jgi:cytochrome c